MPRDVHYGCSALYLTDILYIPTHVSTHNKPSTCPPSLTNMNPCPSNYGSAFHTPCTADGCKVLSTARRIASRAPGTGKLSAVHMKRRSAVPYACIVTSARRDSTNGPHIPYFVAGIWPGFVTKCTHCCRQCMQTASTRLRPTESGVRVCGTCDAGEWIDVALQQQDIE